MPHDRWLRDQSIRTLPFDVQGLLALLHAMVASTIPGNESGDLYGEDGTRLKVEDLLFQLCGVDDAREEWMLRSLKLLVRARQLNAKSFEKGYVRLVHWREDQEMPANGDVERKQVSADAAMVEEAKAFVPVLEKWFAEHGHEKVMESDLLNLIRVRRKGYAKTQIRFLSVLFSSGVLVKDASTLASLALPPSGVGSVGNTVGVGAGQKIVPVGKFPVDKNKEPEPDKDTPSGIQLVSVGAPADTRSHLVGGESERSERQVEPAPHDSQPGRSDFSSSSDSGRSSDSQPLGAERPIMPPVQHCDFMYEPADAFRVEDPVQAAERLLCSTPGWNSVEPRGEKDPPLSQFAILARWKAMRRDQGPRAADVMWRWCLQAHIEDMTERRALRRSPPRSWTGLFMSRLKKVTPADVEHLQDEAVRHG
jgi:hypothetical protein